MGKIKKPRIIVGPIQLSVDQADVAGDYIWNLQDYREFRYNTHEKIRTRLFYEGDNLEAGTWLYRLPLDPELLLRVAGELVTTKFDHRVGLIEYEYMINFDLQPQHLGDTQNAIIFESHSDMLVFKLRAQL